MTSIQNTNQTSAKLSNKSQQQFTQYLANYRFERDPFSDLGISGLFFSAGGRRQAVESLLHYLRYGTTPVFLTGHVGSGKTATLNAFVSELESDVDIAVIEAVLMMTPGQFFTAVADGFGIDQRADRVIDLTSLSQILLEFIGANAASERLSLICVDNVQDLTSEVVRAIFALIAAAGGELHVLFVGEQQATSILEGEAERTGLLLNRIELPVFDQQEVSAYLSYRLDSVGYGGEFPLSEMQVQALSYRHQGSLSQLHQLARSMLIAGMDNLKPERSPFPFPHIIALVILSIVIVIGWRHGESVDPKVEPAPIVLESAANKVVDTDPVIDTVKEVSVASGSIADKVQSPVVVAQPNDKPSLVTQTPATASPAEASNEKTLAEVRQALESLNTQAEASVDGAIEQAAVVAKDTEIDASAQQTEADTLSTPAPTANDKPLAPITETPIVAVDRVTSGVIQVESAHKRLMAWSDVGYALQIFGTHNAKRAKQLVDQYFGDADLLFYETRHNGKPWYVVVNGPYTGREAAKQSIDTLPESIQRLRPWPRNIASIQADIRRYSAAIAADG